jgi:hypothetical protein
LRTIKPENAPQNRSLKDSPDAVVALFAVVSLVPSGSTQRLLELAQEVQKAYQIKTGTLLPIQLNEADKSIHNNELQFNISKLQTLLGNFTPKQEMALEATRIFELLS